MELSAIQSALKDAALDGWLFYDFRGSDPTAQRILGLSRTSLQTRRWFYFIPARGEPTKIVHAIESTAIDLLPGGKLVYLPWQQLHDHLRLTVGAGRKIAMQFSAKNNIPYVAKVDAGTVDLIRSFGVEVTSSADLIQQFEATISPEQWESHVYAADRLAALVPAVFQEIGRRLAGGIATTEYDIQQFMVERYARDGLISDHAPIVAVSENAADPHYEPTPARAKRIEPGQIVLVDTWAKRDLPGAIYADITWMGYTGTKVPERFTQVFNIVRDARDAAIEAVRKAQASGQKIRGCDVDDACRKVIHDTGFGPYFIHRTGHSIHETDHGNGANIDNLETCDDRQLIPRTLFSIEPGIYLTGDFGIRSEVDVFLPDARSLCVSGAPPQTAITPIPL
ncbi:MAG: M24 family metallopeptidase [Planctomycetota bacterium]